MDPITAISVATSAYQALVKGFQAGRQIESMTKDMGRWMNAINEVKQGHEKAKKRRFFGSVEEEALETFAAKKKAEKMEEELRNFIQWNYGVTAWQEVLRIQATLRKERLEQKLQRERLIKEIVQWILVMLGIVVVSVIIISIAWVVSNAS